MTCGPRVLHNVLGLWARSQGKWGSHEMTHESTRVMYPPKTICLNRIVLGHTWHFADSWNKQRVSKKYISSFLGLCIGWRQKPHCQPPQSASVCYLGILLLGDGLMTRSIQDNRWSCCTMRSLIPVASSLVPPAGCCYHSSCWQHSATNPDSNHKTHPSQFSRVVLNMWRVCGRWCDLRVDGLLKRLMAKKGREQSTDLIFIIGNVGVREITHKQWMPR